MMFMIENKRKVTRRILAAILCAVMAIGCVSLSPATAKADDVKMLGSLSIKVGKSKPIEMNGVNESQIIWSSTKPSVATVTNEGLKGIVKAKKAGKTKILAKCVTLGKTYGVYLTVTGGKSVSLNKTNIVLVKGKSEKLKLNKATASKVKWKTKNKKVATVSKKGVVKAKKKGKTTITATYKKKTYKCKVKVENKAKKVSIKTLSKKKRSVTAKPNKKVSVGNIKKDGYKVTIPAGAFDKNTKVTVKTSGKKIFLEAKGKKYVRLNQPVTIQLALSGKVNIKDVDYWKGVYFFGKQEKYMDPDLKKLQKGVLEFQTTHFSGYSGKELTALELRAAVAYMDAVNTISKDCQNNLIGSALEAGLGKVVEQLGFPKDSPEKEKILKQLGKSTKLIELIRAGAEGDESAFLGKTAEAITEVLIENADSSKVGYLGAAVGSLPEALQSIKNEDYKGASTAVLKAVTSNIPYVKAAQFTISICQTSINYYVDSEMEDGYKAYYGLLKDGESGYSMKNGDGWNIIEQQMACPFRQMNDNAIKEYAAAKGVSVSSLTKEEQDQVRAMVKNNIVTQFEYRAKHQAEIEAKKADTMDLMKYLSKEGLMVRGDLSIGFHKEDDYEMRLIRLLNLRDAIKGMLDGKTPADLDNAGGFFKNEEDKRAYNNKGYAKLIAIWVEAGWTPGSNGVKGRAAVAKYLAKTYGIGVSLVQGTKFSMKVGEQVKFSLKGAYGSGTWLSTNTKIATVDSSGNVKALKKGTVTIIANYAKKQMSCLVTITEAEDPNVVKIKGLEDGGVEMGYLKPGQSSRTVEIDFKINGQTKKYEPTPLSWSVEGAGASIVGTKDTLGNDVGKLTFTQAGNLNVIVVYNGIKYVAPMKVVVSSFDGWDYYGIDADKKEW